MISIDKIKASVHPKVIESIDKLVQLNNTEKLNNWLMNCNIEIRDKKELKYTDKEIYNLFCEKYYLEMILQWNKNFIVWYYIVINYNLPKR